MITVYRVFQILMGIIISGFVFYLLVSFAGDYSILGRQGISQKTLEVFLQDVDTAYLSGNPIEFEHFNDDYSICYPTPTSPPRISCFMEESSVESERLLLPILMRAGDQTLIARSSLDYGWTRLDYILALSDMTVVFNPRDESDVTWNLIKEIAGAFPDTTDYKAKVYFNFCDHSQLMITEDIPQRDTFLGISSRDALDPCTASLSSNQVLVTISDSCSQSFSESGVCIVPSPTGVGRAYITGSEDTYVYKDVADLLALIVGGSSTNILGEPIGGETWRFKNEFMLDELKTSARVMGERCRQLLGMYSSENPCKASYDGLMNSLMRVGSLADSDYGDPAAMGNLLTWLGNSRDRWQELLDKGCERYGS